MQHCFVLLGLCLVNLLSAADTSEQLQVRVLLEKTTISSNQEWFLKNLQGFIIQDLDDPQTLLEIPEEVLHITTKKNGVYVNGKRLGVDRLQISARNNNSIALGEYSYAGIFQLVRIGSLLYLINVIELEEYVYSVLRWESWPGWPLEVNKAFAIACRSYVVAKLIEHRLAGKKKPVPYDIKATNLHQTYKGVHEFKDVWQAIEETRGIVLAYKGKPIIAMYDCCCGGIVPAHIQGVNFKAAPYLARPYACTFCKNSKLFRWKVTYDIATFEQMLHQEHNRAIKIQDIKVTKKDRAGVVQEVVVQAPKKQTGVRMSGKKVYSLCKEIKSLSFRVKIGPKIEFEGVGFGHHLGLCQWGSREMVRHGRTYTEILEYYYPKTTFMKVMVS